jgi:hypothetical protein
MPKEFAGPVVLKTCKTCKRTLNAAAMKAHAKVCKKVFMTKRKCFKVSKYFIHPPHCL